MSTKKLIKALGLIIVVALLAAALPLQAKAEGQPGEVWVCTTGDCGHPGVSYNTIQAAINAAAAGDTINVAAGSYNENVTVDKQLTIVGAGAESVTVDALVSTLPCFHITADGVSLSGFTVTGALNGSTDAILLDSADNCTISNNIATNNYWGITLYNAKNNTLTGNVANLNTAVGIGLSGADTTGNQISANTASNNASTGILLSPGVGGNNIIDGNTVSANGKNGVSISSSNNTVTNNTITGNATTNTQGAGIALFDPVSGNTIQFNTITGNTGFGGVGSTSSGTNDISKNWWGSATGPTNSDNPGGTGDVLWTNKSISLLTYSPWLANPAVHNVTQGTYHATIQAAIDAASAGDVIEVSPGTYNENITINKAGITLQSTGTAEETIINADGGIGVSILKDLGTVTIDGFTVQGWLTSGIEQATANRQGTTSRILNNIVVGETGDVNHGNCIQVTGDNSLIEGNTVTGAYYIGTGPYGASGILVYAANNVIVRNNTVSGADIGISVTAGAYHNLGPITGVLVEENEITNSIIGISVTFDAKDTLIKENFVHGNELGLYEEFYLGKGPTGTVALNNRIVDNEVQAMTGASDETLIPADHVFKAEENWWGDVAGPGATEINDYVDYSPWLGATPGTTPMTWYTNDSIQDAINAATAGDTIHVAAGEYVENINIPVSNNVGKQLNFIGEVDAEGKPLPVIKGTLSASGLTGKTWSIENLKFMASGGDSISLNNGGNLTVSNCIFDGVGENNHRAIQASGSNQLTVENSIFQNGWYVSLQGNYASLNVKNSTFTNVKSGINVQGPAGNTVTIDNTDFSVIARGAASDTYGVRFASSSTSGKDLTITNSNFVVDKQDFVAEPGTYHSAIIIRSGATGALKVENSSILGEVVNLATPVLDASPNWWGSVAGPASEQILGTGSVTYDPWCGDADCSFVVSNTPPSEGQSGFYINSQGQLVVTGTVNVPGGIEINEPGLTVVLKDDAVIQNNSLCFVVNADYVTIDAELGAKCIPTNGSDGIVVSDGVEGLRIVGIEITGIDPETGDDLPTGDGIHFDGAINNFQIVDNYIHDLDGSAIEFVGTPSGTTMHIQGNLFQNLGAAAIVVPTGLEPDLNAEFNSWGVYAGATLTDVDTEAHTHADFYMEYEGIIPLEKVAVGNTITYTVYGNLQNISGADFTLKFPTAYLDATTLTNKSAFTAVPNGPNMFIVDEEAGTIRFQGDASLAPITGKNLPIFEVVFTGTAAGTGAISFDQTNDVFAMSPGYGPSTWVYAAGYVDRTVEVFEDSYAPTLETWTPAEGDIYLAGGEDFVLTVDASDDNLFSLEIDHSLEDDLPEFSVYANETDPYGGDEALFDAAGLEVTYNSLTQTWVLTFDSAGSALEALLAKKNVEFYAVLHDQAGKTWGSMDPTTDENTFAYTIVFDNTPPTLESWTPAKDATYMLTPSGDFVVTVDASDINLYELEIDHSLEDDLPEFSVYADETDPYGGDGALFAAAGLEVTYNSSTQTWMLTFENGGPALNAIIANQGITFYAVIHDLAGNKWGSMYDVTADNTFAYTLYQQQPIARADSTGGDDIVAVVTADGNTINFTGEVDWYPADPDLGRTSGHRIGVRLSAPELDFGTSDTTFTFNGQTYDWDLVKDGDDYVLVYPKVTAEIQTWEIVVTWGGGFSQTFTVNFDGTLGPVTAYTVDGEISMQGRVARDTEDVIKLTGYGTDIFTADSLDKLGINYTLANVLTGEYTITTHQPRYLNITTGLAKKITLISNRTLPPLELRAGNVVEDEEIDVNDASLIGTYYGQTGDKAADANFDLRVNIQDLALVGGNFGLTSETAYDTEWMPFTTAP